MDKFSIHLNRQVSKPEGAGEVRRNRCKVVGPFNRIAEPKNSAGRLKRVAGTAR